MDESGGAPDDDSTDVNRQPGRNVINIAPDGDVILDVTFNNSKETLRQARKAAQSFSSTRKPAAGPTPILDLQVKVAYRVSLAALRHHSVYFQNLLTDTRFAEGRAITEALQRLSLDGVDSKGAEPSKLPWITIVDDDEATRSAGREIVFEDLLRALHGDNAVKPQNSMQYAAVMTVLADRFICLPPVARHIFGKGLFKWPAEKVRPLAREDERVLAHEENLRQKILVAWLLKRPPNFHAATRDLILKGSVRWSPYHEPVHTREGATWFDLQDDLERELQFRRECVMNTIASMISHFLRLYTSRTRQCRLGYDSSAACDSYQLGEMIRFLTAKGLVYLVDFSTSSSDQIPDSAVRDIPDILATLKQCTSYQIDKNHTNCGLRTRLLPIIDYIEECLGQYCVGLVHQSWLTDREAASWLVEAEVAEQQGKKRPFKLTRQSRSVGYDKAVAGHSLGWAAKARATFTATSWDWTPEE